jgi:hypothetical protein
LTCFFDFGPDVRDFAAGGNPPAFCNRVVQYSHARAIGLGCSWRGSARCRSVAFKAPILPIAIARNWISALACE